MAEPKPGAPGKLQQKDPIVWCDDEENLLKVWCEVASCYRFMYLKSYYRYKKKNMKFTLPIIIISSITSIAGFSQNSFPSSIAKYLPIIAGFLNLVGGLLTTVAQFLKVSEILEGSRQASLNFAKLVSSITTQLNIPPKNRAMSGNEFINQVKSDMDRLLENSPMIDREILDKFKEQISQFDSAKGMNQPDIVQLSGFKQILKKAPETIAAEKLEKKIEQFNAESPKLTGSDGIYKRTRDTINDELNMISKNKFVSTVKFLNRAQKLTGLSSPKTKKGEGEKEGEEQVQTKQPAEKEEVEPQKSPVEIINDLNDFDKAIGMLKKQKEEFVSSSMSDTSSNLKVEIPMETILKSEVSEQKKDNKTTSIEVDDKKSEISINMDSVHEYFP